MGAEGPRKHDGSQFVRRAGKSWGSNDLELPALLDHIEKEMPLQPANSELQLALRPVIYAANEK